jgi:hypothetical protein
MESEAEIFDGAVSRPVEDRKAYLDAACGSNAELRERLELLLQSHEALGFMEDCTEQGKREEE